MRQLAHAEKEAAEWRQRKAEERARAAEAPEEVVVVRGCACGLVLPSGLLGPRERCGVSGRASHPWSLAPILASKANGDLLLGALA